MIFKRFYDQQLAQASYLLACEASGEALVVDPNRDIDFYVREAKREGLRIAHVTETHVHADFVSGSRELAHVTKAQLYLSDEGGDDWRYTFAAESGATLLKNGDTITFGRVRVMALHTPGHTPEHLAFLVTDLAASSEPIGLLSGDFLFVGEVGRPDLLERAAGQAGTMDAAARALFKSLQSISQLPDYIQIWPGHGAGSACGKSLGAMPQSTLGYERMSNWALRATKETAFVEEVLSGQPTPPRYFATMKRVNKEGPAILGGLPAPRHLQLKELQTLGDGGGTIVDGRTSTAFSREHIAGALNIPLNKSFTKWAGSILPYDADFCLVTSAQNGHETATAAARDLAMIGLDRLQGFVTEEIFESWRAAGRKTETSVAVTAAAAADQIMEGAATVLDVREAYEFDDARLNGALNIPLGNLKERVEEVPRGKPVVVYCQTGSRSAIATSILQSAGMEAVANLSGGITGWQRAGLPTQP